MKKLIICCIFIIFCLIVWLVLLYENFVLNEVFVVVNNLMGNFILDMFFGDW